MAAELLDIYARREAKQGIYFDTSIHDYNTFAASFPFEETPDQESAIDDVLQDMGSNRPMDRVVCGDVGFGKTEVAMRGAFIAVSNGKQVSVLVPTTLPCTNSIFRHLATALRNGQFESRHFQDSILQKNKKRLSML